jgi:hypothetical protein
MKKQLLVIALALSTTLSATAEDKVLNLYSARHYQTDEKLRKLHEADRHQDQPDRRHGSGVDGAYSQ